MADFLERKDAQIHVITETSAADGIGRLTAGDEVFDFDGSLLTFANRRRGRRPLAL